MYSCKQTVTWSRGVKKKGAKKGAKSDMTYCLKVICCRVIKQTKNKQKTKNPPGESKLQTVLLNKSSSVLKDYLFETLKLAKQTATALVG